MGPHEIHCHETAHNNMAPVTRAPTITSEYLPNAFMTLSRAQICHSISATRLESRLCVNGRLAPRFLPFRGHARSMRHINFFFVEANTVGTNSSRAVSAGCKGPDGTSDCANCRSRSQVVYCSVYSCRASPMMMKCCGATLNPADIRLVVAA